MRYTFFSSIFLVETATSGSQLRSFKTAKIIESNKNLVFHEQNQFSNYPIQITRQSAMYLNKFDNKYGKPQLGRSKRATFEPVGVTEEFKDKHSGIVIRVKRNSDFLIENVTDKRVGRIPSWISPKSTEQKLYEYLFE